MMTKPSARSCAAAALDTVLLEEAANWAMLFQYGTPTESERQDFEHWRQQSLAHDAAWARAQTVFNIFDQVPAKIRKQAVKNLEHGYDRRRALQLMSSLLVAIPAASWLTWRELPWREWTADIATATGEHKVITLPDGSRMALNTGGAVNIAFDSKERRIRLVTGEILITTHTDPAQITRPFLVETQQGIVRAMGTRFHVRCLDNNQCRVAVFEHAVEIQSTGGSRLRVHAGEQSDFSATHIASPVPVADSAVLWEQGMLMAQDMPLADVIAELARYRPGILRCDPEVADLLVSGALSLKDTDASLALLEKSLPVRISRVTPYWVTVSPQH